MKGTGGVRRGLATDNFDERTKIVHGILAEYAKAIFGDEATPYRKSYEAGRYTNHDVKHGLWLGRALVWKLQVALHRDRHDGPRGICCCFNGGFYEAAEPGGGMMMFPDLDLIFE